MNNNIANIMANNVLFKYIDECRAYVYYIHKIEKKNKDGNITTSIKPKINKEFILYMVNNNRLAIKDLVGKNKIESVINTYTDDFKINIHYNFEKRDKYEYDGNIELKYDNLSNKMIYIYNSKFITAKEKDEEVVKTEAVHITNDYRTGCNNHFIVVAFPVNKTVPIIIDFTLKDDKLFNLLNENNIIIASKVFKDSFKTIFSRDNIFFLEPDFKYCFDSYLDTFNSSSYIIKKKANNFKVKNSKLDAKIKLIDYTKYDTFKEADNRPYYINTYTGISSTLIQREDGLTEFAHYIDGMLFDRLICSFNGLYQDVFKDHLEENGNIINYRDLGSRKDGLEPHMKRITTVKNLTENELKLITSLPYVKKEDINCRRKYDPNKITDKTLGLFFPYLWVDKDTTENGSRHVEILGTIPSEDNKPVSISITIINEKVMIETVEYKLKHKSIKSTSFYKINSFDISKPIYSYKKTEEEKDVVSNTMIECNISNGMKFKIANKITKNDEGATISELYKYVSPELSVFIDVTNSKLLEFNSDLYNLKYMTAIPVRDEFGCIDHIPTANLKE